MHIKELWRYPVKSMRGESLDSAAVQPTGMAGDRGIVVVSRARDRIITARTHPGLLGLQGALRSDGVVTIDGLPWNTSGARSLASEAAGTHVDLVEAGEEPGRFDVLPLLVATDGAIAALGLDGRRLRPNIVVGGVQGHAERNWPSRILRSGDVRIAVAQLRQRCVMTTYDPDTLQQDRRVLVNIVRQAEGKTALDCSVLAPGTLRINDLVSLETSAFPQELHPDIRQI
jgi:uncharacterized protein YcbX